MQSVSDLQAHFINGTLSPVDHVESVLDSIREVNKTLNAVSWFRNKEDILRDAKRSEQRYRNGKHLGPFDGVSVTVKDIASNACEGVPLKNGSMMEAIHRIPTESAPHIAVLQKQGAIILCQTTSPELGFKATTSTELHGVTRNPHDLSLSSGGSSGVIFSYIFMLTVIELFDHVTFPIF